ncbi:MAG: hypothetical protein ACPLW9_00475 [Minisyncoccales bacterium]
MIEKITKNRAIVNLGFGNQCSICGGYFDEGGICPNGHELGAIYVLNEEKEKLEQWSGGAMWVICGRTGPQKNQCNICGTFFETGSLECDRHHIVGQRYLIPVVISTKKEEDI